MRFLLFFIFLAGVYSCGRQPTPEEYQQLVKTLEHSNELIADAATIDYRELVQKRHHPETEERALQWMPLTETVRSRTEALVSFLDTLKGGFGTKGGVTDADIRRFLQSLTTYGDILYTLLPDSSDRHKLLDASGQLRSWKKMASADLQNMPRLEAQGHLTQLQNGLRSLEGLILHYTNKRIGYYEDFFHTAHAFAGVNALSLKKGEQLEVSAILFSPSPRTVPEYRIAGQDIPLNDDGVAIYRELVSGPPGKRSVRVVCTYLGPDRERHSIWKDVHYSVVK